MARAISFTRALLTSSWLNVLLVFLPLAAALELTHAPQLWVFGAAAVAIIPLAGLIGHATDELAGHTGPGVGGLLNATFGNATELIIAIIALIAGLPEVVKASLTGSIIGNLLLVLGLSMFVGGFRHERQEFNQTAASAASSMLFVEVIALILPAVYDLAVYGSLEPAGGDVARLSLLVAFVLFVTYLASLVFSLITHRDLLSPDRAQVAEAHGPTWSVAAATSVLLVATLLTAYAAELLVGAVESATQSLGWTEFFVGVIVVAIVGNAAEHFSAILFAAENKMELAIQISIGSSTQIALLVAPVLVFASHLLGRPMSLVFNPFEIVAVALAALIVAMVTRDGESNWFEGLQLIAVYIMMGIAFYFVPAQALAGSKH